ncbi:MAG: hypothetical protein Q8S01_05150 [Ignavibacteria bacterium]|nr:hypothetical protein [Ignavibacteria bacterium]
MNLFRILVVVVLLCASGVIAQQPLIFEVNYQKQTYLVGESIDLGRSVKNVGSLTQELTGRITVTLQKESGEVLHYYEPHGDWYYPSGELLPNEESYRVIDLNEKFGKRYSFRNYHHLLDSGKYTAEVSYGSTNIQNNTIRFSFQVIPPKGDEEIILNSFVKMAKSDTFNTTDEFIKAAYSLMNSHPHSVYNPIILSEIVSTFRISFHDLIEGLATGKELIEKYPWSAKGAYMLNPVLNNLTTEQERIAFLKKLLPLAQNSPMQKLLELKLKAEMEE